ncbi:hypothetical protein F2Q70_00012927 [Brassica cretica]|uniref:Uncharacterized protein n=1 Tax=Brassica cretica TaxID=69181 RepID=A0A8S9M405_BRACR|nr:hypothetical protein F2Q70_00012927 [Brassica cretica]
MLRLLQLPTETPERTNAYNPRSSPKAWHRRRNHWRYEEKPRSDDAVIQWFAPEITVSIAFHRDRVHPSNCHSYKEDGSENGQPSKEDKTDA